MKHPPFIMLMDSVGDEFRQSTVRMACLCFMMLRSQLRSPGYLGVIHRAKSSGGFFTHAGGFVGMMGRAGLAPPGMFAGKLPWTLSTMETFAGLLPW